MDRDQEEVIPDKAEDVVEQNQAGPQSPEGPVTEEASGASQNVADTEDEPVGSALPRQIFVVISRREDFNADCLQAIRSYDIAPIVLNDPDQILSVTEMVNQSRRVCFALILLAGDDFIYDRLSGKPGDAFLGAKPEAVFFFGYLLAKFGNAGTMALYREQKSFRLPVGIQHGVFVPYEKNGNWKSVFESKLKMLKIL